MTITQIAEQCGVSFQTVSRVLNGKGHLHADTTVRKVKEMAKEMGYVTNLFAKSMRGGKSFSIGIIMDPFQESFTEELFSGAHDVLMGKNYLPILLLNNKGKTPDMLVRQLAERRVEGLLLRPNMDCFQGVGVELKRYHLPVVCMDERLSCGYVTDFVGTNDTLGEQLGAEHLLSLGHRCFAGLFLDKPILAERRRAFEQTVFKHSDATIPYIMTDWNFDDDEANKKKIQVMLSDTPAPTALVACGDFMLPVIYRAARELGLRIPEDLSVLGFGDTSFSRNLVPATTTIHQDAYKIGQEAAKMLLRRIERNTFGEPFDDVHFDPFLIRRDSTAAPHV